MLSEIEEQPSRVRDAFAAVEQQVDVLAGLTGRCRQVVLLGRGSSRSAATFAAQAFRTFTAVPASSVSPAHLAWSGAAERLQHTLVVAISQSGESIEIVAAARKVLSAGGELVVVTNSPESTLAAMVDPDLVVAFRARPEVAVPATKSFTTSLACLLGIATANHPRILREAAAGIPELMAAAIQDPAVRFDVAGAGNLVCAGEGFAESVGEEAAIKFRETLRLPVASFETSEFLHGSINSVDESTAVVIVAADELGRHLADEAVGGARQRGARTVTVGSYRSSGAHQHMRLPDVPPHWMPFLAVLPIQRAAHDAALARGHDPDVPNGLTKVTQIREMDES